MSLLDICKSTCIITSDWFRWIFKNNFTVDFCFVNIANELIFKCKGSFATAEVRRAESEDSMKFIQQHDANKIIQGIFSLKNLGYFIKCTNLCSQIEIYLENDLPLVVKYDVASLGTIRLCLSALPSS